MLRGWRPPLYSWCHQVFFHPHQSIILEVLEPVRDRVRVTYRVSVGLDMFFDLLQGFKLYLVFCAPTCQVGLPGLQIVDCLVHNLLDFRRYIAMAFPTLYHKFSQRKWNCACFHVVSKERGIYPISRMLCAHNTGWRTRLPSADVTLIL